jgi:flagellar biogenesis protein FliO
LLPALALTAPALAQPIANPMGPLEATAPEAAPADQRETAGDPVASAEASEPERAPALSPTESRPLGAAPARAAAATEPAGEAEPSFLADHPVVRTLGALALVVSIIFALRSLVQTASRRAGGVAGALGPGGRAPSGVLSVLGRYPVGKGQTLVLLQLDRRVLLLSQSSGGFQTLAELTDADEVASVVRKTADDEGVSLSKRFSSMLRTFERDPKISGGAGARAPMSPRRAMALRDYEASVLEAPVSEMPEMDSYDAIRRRLGERLDRLRGGAS